MVSCNSTEVSDTSKLSNIPVISNFDDDSYLEKDPVAAAIRSAPFSKGVNFSEWFESPSAEVIPFINYTEQDFIDVKNLGADVVRLPIRLHSMTSGPPYYTINPILFKLLDIAVDWAEKYGLYIILENASSRPGHPTDDDVDKILLPVWTQMANHFKNRTSYVIYEIFSEPYGSITSARWGEIQGKVIETIRRYDQDRIIIIGGTDWNSIDALSAVPNYKDPNLIYTFHFYDPVLFTHQGADWMGPPSYASLKGVPFPYDKKRMPRIPSDLKGTWISDFLAHSYPNAATYKALSDQLNKAVAFSLKRDVPIFCGEFGVLRTNCRNEDRVRWYKYVANALSIRNISRTSWDYYGDFGIFNIKNGNFDYELNIDIVKALKFTSPPQYVRIDLPLNTGFVIYDDFPNRERVRTLNFTDYTDFNMYDSNSSEGEFAIRWGNVVAQYDSFTFGFESGSKDFSYLVKKGFYLEFYARTESPVSFAVRFINSETSNSLPWRMNYIINEKKLPADGKYHRIRIPLTDMYEQGAFLSSTQKWLTPKGEFSWKSVESLQFAAEYASIKNYIWFDDIKISKQK